MSKVFFLSNTPRAFELDELTVRRDDHQVWSAHDLSWEEATGSILLSGSVNGCILLGLIDLTVSGFMFAQIVFDEHVAYLFTLTESMIFGSISHLGPSNFHVLFPLDAPTMKHNTGAASRNSLTGTKKESCTSNKELAWQKCEVVIGRNSYS